MESPSSTSSSRAPGAEGRRLPWGAFVALAILLGAERGVFGRLAFWDAAEARLEAVPKALVRVEQGIVRDRIALAGLRRAPADRRRVIVMGNSRALDGFQFERVPPSMELVKLTHAPISPLELRLFAREALASGADLLVMMLSEFDTHRPMRIVPRAGFADLRATLGLGLDCLLGRHGTSAGFLLEQRVPLERLAVAACADAFRYRDVLDRAWLDDALGFAPDADGRLGALMSHDLEELPADPAQHAELEVLRARFPEPARVSDTTLMTLRNIRSGPHAAANEALVEQAAALLAAGGCRLLIVEGPLHPVSYGLYDHAGTRAEFLAFLHRLQAEQGVDTLTLDETGPYPARSFVDALHLTRARGRELGARTLERATALLAP